MLSGTFPIFLLFSKIEVGFMGEIFVFYLGYLCWKYWEQLHFLQSFRLVPRHKS